jgi:two-component system, OmpR family, alkaline phosphatase synthesis response regulator PhoP
LTRILLIEDNPDLALGLRNNLEIEGYEVTTAADGRAGLEVLPEVNPDLLILDLMLPELDGFRVLKTLRQKAPTLPVLILTAKGEEADKVRGFRLGADDYVTKPFGLLELLARVERLLQRSPERREAHAAVRRFGRIEVDPSARTVRREARLVPLTPKELDLLLALLDAQGRAVSRLELLREVWGYSPAAVSRTVDTHVAELRRKLEDDPSSPRHILTVRKLGYRIDTGG